ncbi:MBL fold metallo-hydrolase [Tepidibacillus marianensis]|uniref:MBL fold metallo-hydrolase n=1 Tax=Tepidibacillus marianensis TaxID=3131995 RepID=UPI0030CD41B9
MEITRIGSKGVIFSFPELDQVNLVAIYGEQFTYLCDTYIGPEPMVEIKSFLAKENRKKPILIFNSHWDWDHVWGNCAFPNSIIVSHKLCLENLEKGFWNELERNKQYTRGDVTPLFPNLVFTDQLIFVEDQVKFFHTPGHTKDSSSCYGLEESILYVGDNVEYPIPYVSYPDVITFIQTLENYIRLNPKHLITGHGDVWTMELIKENLQYLKRLVSKEKIDNSTWSQEIKQRHQDNIEMMNRKHSEV